MMVTMMAGMRVVIHQTASITRVGADGENPWGDGAVIVVFG
jgi:hypothetical protein